MGSEVSARELPSDGLGKNSTAEREAAAGTWAAGGGGRCIFTGRSEAAGGLCWPLRRPQPRWGLGTRVLSLVPRHSDHGRPCWPQAGLGAGPRGPPRARHPASRHSRRPRTGHRLTWGLHLHPRALLGSVCVWGSPSVPLVPKTLTRRYKCRGISLITGLAVSLKPESGSKQEQSPSSGPWSTAEPVLHLPLSLMAPTRSPRGHSPQGVSHPSKRTHLEGTPTQGEGLTGHLAPGLSCQHRKCPLNCGAWVPQRGSGSG